MPTNVRAVSHHQRRGNGPDPDEPVGAAPDRRISAQILGDSAQIIQTGSRALVFGGLALLATMAISLAWDGAGRWGAGVRSKPAAT